MKKYEKELKDAIQSGDVDRISIAKNRLHQRKMRLSSTPQNLWDGGGVLPGDANESSTLSPEEKKVKNAATANKVAGVASVGASMVSSLIDPNREDGTINVGQNMAKSALQMGGSGAAAGAMLGGPVGAVVGGVIGTGVGLLTGNSQAKKQNEAIAKEKKRIKNKAFIGRLNTSVAEEENTFNVNSPQYLAKGGLVRSEKKPVDMFATKKLTPRQKEAQNELRDDQEFLSEVFDKKYGELTKLNLKNILVDYTLNNNYSSKELDSYHKKLSDKYQDLALTPAEIKEKMGEKRYARYIDNKKEYSSTEYKEGYSKTFGANEENIDYSKENFGWRNVIERFPWNREKDVSPYTYLRNNLPKDKKGKPLLFPTMDQKGNYIFNEGIDATMKKQGFAKGGFVLGKGTATSDSNSKKVEVGSQVIPSVKNSPKNLKNVVLNIAENTNLDSELKGTKSGQNKAKVNLSKGELVIPPEKITQAESVANAQGTTLDEVRNTINTMNTKTKKPSKVNLYLGTDRVEEERKRNAKRLGLKDETFTPAKRLFSKSESLPDMGYIKPFVDITKPKFDLTKKQPLNILDPENKIKNSFNRFDKENKVLLDKAKTKSGTLPTKPEKRNFSIAPEAAIGILQTAAGAIGKSRNESKINKSLAIQKAIAEQSALDATTAAEKSLSAKKASINTMFKDTQTTADKLKVNAINDLGGNSLTSQEFSSNYNKVAGTVLDSVSRANKEKTSMILDAESQGFSNIQNVNERGTALNLGVEGKKNAFNLAKATQSGLLQQAGMENLLGYMKNIKDEKIRKAKMAEIIALADKRKISLAEAATIYPKDFFSDNG